MSTSAVMESLWQALVKRMPQDSAAQILNDVKDSVLVPLSTRKIEMVHREVVNCKRCPNFQYLNNTAVWNTKDPEALVVLEKPSIGSGASGVLIEGLRKAGFTKENSAITYYNRCLPENGNIKQEHKDNCKGFLEEEIYAMNPSVVIACGKSVSEQLLGPILQVSKMRGDLYWAGNFAIMITYSPSYVASDKTPDSLRESFFEDIATAARACKKQKGSKDDE